MGVDSGAARYRIAPSPTGSIHVGTARTALYNWLLARQSGGTFVLRVEDTARDRNRPEFEQAIYAGLAWLGLDWDEGPDVGGDYGPYRQSERLQIHRRHLQRLIERGHVYRCFCSREQLAEERKAAQRAKTPPRYSGRCRNLSESEVQSRLEAGEPASFRFKVIAQTVEFDDLVLGRLREDSALWGDFIVARSDGSPVYNFAVVADDHDMAITHVLRGADHISNTFKQVAMYEALGWELPRFGHIPLTLNARRQKLSKRDGSVSIQEYRDLGYLPEAVNNFIALLGWNPGDEREFFSLQELVSEFSADRINRANAIFDQDRLDWFSGNYVRGLPLSELTRRAWDYLEEFGYFLPSNGAPDSGPGFEAVKRPARDYFESALALEQERIRRLSDLPGVISFFFRDKVEPDPKLLVARRQSPEASAAALARVADWTDENDVSDQSLTEQFLRGLADELGWKSGVLFMPIRIAITGSRATPPLFATMAVLGSERVSSRLRAAVELLGG
jgi:glutamyl-tRNA synthetase